MKARASIMSAALLLLCVLRTLSSAERPPADVHPFSPGVVHRMMSVRDSAGLDGIVRLLDAQPLYVRESIGQQLVSLVDKEDKLEWDELRPSDYEHDPRVVGARAAFVLESCYGFEIPSLSHNATQEQRSQARALAALQMRAFEDGIRQARREGGLEGVGIQSLREKYHDRIRASIPPEGKDLRYEDREAFLEMLSQWYPLGKRIEDLETIVGQKGQIRTEPDTPIILHLYNFFHPRTAFEIRFAVQDGLIVSVDIEAGEG